MFGSCNLHTHIGPRRKEARLHMHTHPVMKLFKTAFHFSIGYTSHTEACHTARLEESIEIKGAYLSFSPLLLKVQSIIKKRNFEIE